MAIRYVNSNATGANDGTSWADAFTTLAGADAVDTVGDTIWVSDNHAESTALSVAWSFAGTQASPTRIMCADDASGAPPTVLATTGTVAVTGAGNDLTIASTGNLYLYGLTFTVGAGDTGDDNITLAGGTTTNVVAESCNFVLASTGAAASIVLGGVSSTLAQCHQCVFQFADVGQNLETTTGLSAVLTDCSLAGSAITDLSELGAGSSLELSGCDLSTGATAMNLVNTVSANVALLVRNCKLPTSWSGSISSGTPVRGSICDLHNCDAGDTNYRYERKTYLGTITSETTVVRTGGASDGTTPLAWKCVSTADTEWKHLTLDTAEIVRWNETTGSAITATIEIIHDSVTAMTNQQIWLEVQYLGTSGFPLSLFVDDSSGDYLSTAADQTTSSATWGGSLTNPNKQKLSVTFTPQEKGFLHAVIKIAMASKTVFVDPKLVIS